MANHTTLSWGDHGNRTLFSIQVPNLTQILIAMNYTKIAIMGGGRWVWGKSTGPSSHDRHDNCFPKQSPIYPFCEAQVDDENTRCYYYGLSKVARNNLPNVPLKFNLCSFPAIPSPPSNIPISHSVQCRGHISVPSSNPTTIN